MREGIGCEEHEGGCGGRLRWEIVVGDCGGRLWWEIVGEIVGRIKGEIKGGGVLRGGGFVCHLKKACRAILVERHVCEM